MDSFLAPAPRTRIRPCRSNDARTTSLRVMRSSKRPESEEAAPARSSGIIDELWARQDAKSISLPEQEDQIAKLEDGDSDATTKYILIGGTALVLAAAGALAVTLGNDLGIDLELG